MDISHLCRWGIMFDVQSGSNVTDQIHTFDVPIKFTRTQFEKMLRVVDAEASGHQAQPSISEPSNAALSYAVK